MSTYTEYPKRDMWKCCQAPRMEQNHFTSFIWCEDLGESYREEMSPAYHWLPISRGWLIYFPGSHQPQVTISPYLAPSPTQFCFWNSLPSARACWWVTFSFLEELGKRTTWLPTQDWMLKLPIIKQSPHAPNPQVLIFSLTTRTLGAAQSFILSHWFHSKVTDLTVFPLKPILHLSIVDAIIQCDSVQANLIYLSILSHIWAFLKSFAS